MSTRTESRGAFCFYSLHDSQNILWLKAPVLSATRAVLVDVQVYDNTGVLRFMAKKDGKPCIKCGSNEWNKRGDCLPCHRERKRRWQKENPEKNAKYTRKHAEKNREKIAEKVRRWARENPKKKAEKDRRWTKNNPEKRAANRSRRRTRKTKAGGSYTADEWNQLVAHYGGRCLCCGRTDVKLTVDHIVPIAKGGTSNIDNIQPLCGSCNSSKRDKAVDYRPDNGPAHWIQQRLFG